MKRIVYAAAAMLMLAGMYAGANQSQPTTQSAPTVVVADGTAPIPLCDPTYQSCPKMSSSAHQ